MDDHLPFSVTVWHSILVEFAGTIMRGNTLWVRYGLGKTWKNSSLYIKVVLFWALRQGWRTGKNGVLSRIIAGHARRKDMTNGLGRLHDGQVCLA
jgi:hypothetical protein